MASTPGHDRFAALETLRGAAALSVLVFHMLGVVDQAHGGSGRALTHGYLAVDFFFMLSGFVISAAYGERLARGWGPAAFLRQRLRRLYPIYGAALAAGVGVQLALACGLHGRLGGTEAITLCVVTTLAALFLPLLSPVHGEAFPLNGVSWSLSHELLANAAFALARRPPAWLLGAVAAAGAAGCVLLLARQGSLEAGAMQDDYVVGLVRIAFAFPAGVLLHRLHAARVVQAPRARSVTPVVALVLPLALPLSHGPLDAALDGACVFAIFPAVLVLGARLQGGSAAGRGLGRLSYPLYAIHLVFRPLWLVLLPAAPPLLGLAITLSASLAAAAALGALLEPGPRPRRYAVAG